MSHRYEGPAGTAYWEYQRPIGELSADLDCFKFEPYISGNDNVVDFGCGGAFMLERLTAAGKIGIEINDLAREEGIRRGLDIRSSLDEVDPQWADVVISNHALEHVHEPYGTLKAVGAVLRPGGTLVLWLPIDDWRLHVKPHPDDVNGHLYTWTPQLLWNLLTELGFEVETVRVVSRAHLPAGNRSLNRYNKLFAILSSFWSRLRKRRQLCAVARRPLSALGGCELSENRA